MSSRIILLSLLGLESSQCFAVRRCQDLLYRLSLDVGQELLDIGVRLLQEVLDLDKLVFVDVFRFCPVPGRFPVIVFPGRSKAGNCKEGISLKIKDG